MCLKKPRSRFDNLYCVICSVFKFDRRRANQPGSNPYRIFREKFEPRFSEFTGSQPRTTQRIEIEGHLRPLDADLRCSPTCLRRKRPFGRERPTFTVAGKVKSQPGRARSQPSRGKREGTEGCPAPQYEAFPIECEWNGYK